MYSRSAGDRVVVLSMQNLRTTVLDDVASSLWRRLESEPGFECDAESLLTAQVALSGVPPERIAERIQALAQQNLLELRS